MTTGKLFVLSGPSGTGKGTICKAVMEDNEEIRLSISMTTRAPRNGEEHGVHYFFTDKEAFERLIAVDGFIEYADVYGNFYGTPREQVEQWLEEGTDVLLEIDVQGALQVKENFPESILIFILPPSMEVLRQRLTNRGTDAPEVIEKRLAGAAGEIGLLDRYDYSVVNDDLQDAVHAVEAIIVSEHCRIDKENATFIVERYKEE